MQEFAFIAVVMLLVMAGYYSIVILPKQRDFYKRQRFVRTISAGEEVVTFGGVIGKVVAIDSEEGITHLEIADGVVVRMLTAALMQTYVPEQTATKALAEATPDHESVRER